ncbi:hypothetical protein EV401DRAFT_1892167 [Pisolithus croceorrhizus]|nr:hypothetical protein EV401DRAFT_1892167 [Pisolithus croceorrhizus]
MSSGTARTYTFLASSSGDDIGDYSTKQRISGSLEMWDCRWSRGVQEPGDDKESSPVSVAYVDKEDDKEPPFQFPEKPPPLRTQSIFGSFHKRPRSTQEPPTLPSNCESLSSRPSHTSRLRVSVLVAMPATGCSASFSSPQEDSSLEVSRLPPIEIGVVEVDVHG